MIKIRLSKFLLALSILGIFLFNISCIHRQLINQYNSDGKEEGKWIFKTKDSIVYLAMDYKNGVPCDKIIEYDTNGILERLTSFKDHCSASQNRSYVLKGYYNGKNIYKDIVQKGILVKYKVQFPELYRTEYLQGVPKDQKDNKDYYGWKIYQNLCSNCHSVNRLKEKDMAKTVSNYDLQEFKNLFVRSTHAKILAGTETRDPFIHFHLEYFEDTDFEVLKKYVEVLKKDIVVN